MAYEPYTTVFAPRPSTSGVGAHALLGRKPVSGALQQPDTTLSSLEFVLLSAFCSFLFAETTSTPFGGSKPALSPSARLWADKGVSPSAVHLTASPLGLASLTLVPALSRDKRSMAIATSANLTKLNKSELVTMLTDLQTAVELKDAELALVGAAAPVVQQPEFTFPGELMMKGFLRSCIPATRKDGSIVEGLFKVFVQTTVSVNFGGRDKEAWDFKEINHKSTCFVADAETAAQAQFLLDTNGWTVVRSWYKLTSTSKNVHDVAQVDYKTKQKRTDDSGNIQMTRALKYAPDLRLLQLDVLASGENKQPADSGDVL